MIALKVEKIGDRVAVELTEEALQALDMDVGGTLHLEPSPNGVLQVVTREVWVEDPAAPGEAVLRACERRHEPFSAA
ncbi:hypothetical protein [Phenylobacterium deserti]|uniref:AbrB/MazE/SpoVT family DNA-binding domain-containing protein n=1 Tax=Phenylobacterium deserti TaxID=1914756 RepID=A0A328ASB3_9CAUL|nr:hypothetical protein [Phenylobacterium deserti]RAK57953.1 hypothetical protein DJ018_08605 [Phenylobacterium deserti]